MASDSNRRIMKNTGFLYIRMLLIMLVNLYTSRIILEALGIDNYGVFMVVGGVVSMFGFLSASMTSSTQRYLNFELGKEEAERNNKLSNIFRTSFLIHLVIALAILGIGEPLGIWFVNSKLNIPSESIFGGNVVFQTALFSFALSILTVPFNAAIIAHEKMNIFAVISILEALLKLAIAFAIMAVSQNRLALYGILVLSVQGITSICYMGVAIAKFKECSFRVVYNAELVKEMAAFAGWNMFGSIAWLVRNQGMGIVLNIFFGPALNAAKGIADQVANAVTNLNSNFQTALNPQITKNYAIGNMGEMEKLTYRGIRFSTFLLLFLVLPIVMCAAQILEIWLEQVPEYASIFVILILLDALAGNLFGTPLMTALAATGKIRVYQITVSAIIILILPSAYVAMKFGYPPETIFYLNIAFNVLSGLARLVFCKKLIGFSLRSFVSSVAVPATSVAMLSLILPGCLKFCLPQLHILAYISIMSGITIFSTALIIWNIGLDKHEREFFANLFVSRIKKLL